MPIAYIALGSNLHQPRQQIARALVHIAALPNTDIYECARLYRSAPMGPQDQPDFLNTVVAVITTLSPETLLSALLNIEQKMGRVRTRHWGERVIDLDLIAMDAETRRSETLTLPHPRARDREFVIVPLADIAPDFVLIGQGQVRLLARQFVHHTMQVVS